MLCPVWLFKLNSTMNEVVAKNTWLKHVSIPYVLKVVADLLLLDIKQQSNYVSTQSSEILLTELCFANPADKTSLMALLERLPKVSKVWDELKCGCSNGKILPMEILVMLYNRRPVVWEAEVLGIMQCYSTQKVANETSDTKIGSKQSRQLKTDMIRHVLMNGQSNNLWHHSCLINVSAIDSGVCQLVVKLLCQMLIDCEFSLSCIRACHAFVAALEQESFINIYRHFPLECQHLVFVLVTPMCHVHSSSSKCCCLYDELNSVAVDAMCKALQQIITTILTQENLTLIKCMLCFYPISLLVLNERNLLWKYFM